MGTDKTAFNKKRPVKRMISDGLEADGTTFDWGAVPGERLQELIGAVTSRGGAIRFGYSRDGAVGSVGVYYGDERDTLYIRPSEDFEVVFQRIETFFGGKPQSRGAAPQ